MLFQSAAVSTTVFVKYRTKIAFLDLALINVIKGYFVSDHTLINIMKIIKNIVCLSTFVVLNKCETVALKWLIDCKQDL